MKKLTALLLAAVLLCSVFLTGCGSKSKTLTLNVYNWGEYISDGSDDSFDTVREFEKWYEAEYGQKIHVNYDTYASNEDMFAKLSSGAVSFDVVIPSDYMIARMRENDMLLPLNFDNIPNYRYIDESFRGLYYDPENVYTVPYTYGVVGVIYNAEVVDEADAQGWDLLWNEKYRGDILQFNNSRDAFATAQYKLGLDVNDTAHASWESALAELKKQAPLVKSYVMDEIYNMMESGEAAIGAYYAGDYFTMLDAQADGVELKFYYPDPTNYFVDAMCIPSCCQNQELAEIFINYMLSEEPAIANAEYIYYASPNALVYENEDYIDEMGEEAMEILYPGIDDFGALYNQYAYRSLDEQTLDYVNSLWESLKIN
ncbi:MAG: spermidine/putrescine ABC transporter substrate-binding protein [Oscillospiraceae bacterium]|nr:spermidine/putrescine ABC transporter substrate-binding protein [Oscillospiraceae bacterium]